MTSRAAAPAASSILLGNCVPLPTEVVLFRDQLEEGNKVLLVKMTKINTNISWQKRKSEGLFSKSLLPHTHDSLKFWKDRISPHQLTVL